MTQIVKKISDYIFIAGIAAVVAASCGTQRSNNASTGKNYRVEGRVLTTDSSVRIFWPGTVLSTGFTGTTLGAKLFDESGRNSFAVIVDDSLHKVIRLLKGTNEYVLAKELSDTKHVVKLHKLTDWFDGESQLVNFIYPANAKPTAPKENKKWKFEFYGNSITVGAGMFSRKDSLHWPGTATHNYYSYGSVAARRLNASARFIASSGIGLMVSWGNLIMPDIYNLTNPADSSSTWDFSSYQPDVVVINLMQNDHSLIGDKENAQFIRRFGNEAPSADTIIQRYADFVSKIRTHYPNAYILCCLGSMGAVRPGSPFPGYIQKAVTLLNDSRIGTHFFKPIKSNDHPNRFEHEEMADELVAALEKILGKN